jgi:hypothetical protein
MSTKEELVATIKEWVCIDQEIRQLQNEVKLRRVKKVELTNILIDTMKGHDIGSFDINKGKIVHIQNKVRAPVSKKHLVECLSNYFNDSNPELAQEVTKHILDSRQVNIKDNIKFK